MKWATSNFKGHAVHVVTLQGRSYCNILTFDLAKNAIQGDAPEVSDTF